MTGRMANSMLTLPPQLLARILHYAHEGAAAATLLSAALVCRQWRDPAQRQLFAHLTLDLPRHPHRAAQWLASPARTRYLVLSPDATKPSPGGGHDGGHELARILDVCNGVRELRLQIHYVGGGLEPSWSAEDPTCEGVDWGVLRLSSLTGARLFH